MPEPSALALFLATAFVVIVAPGPAVFYIVARSIDQGRIAGVVSMLGISTGALFHVFAAAFGLSALLVSSATAFSVVKYLGAAYLVYLGLRKLLTRESVPVTVEIEPRTLRRLFWEGVIVNILNPKTALFFFAFLPQFVDAANGEITTQFIFLGVLFVIMGIVSDGAYALLAGAARNWLRQATTFWRIERYFAASVFIGLGIATALSGSAKK